MCLKSNGSEVHTSQQQNVLTIKLIPYNELNEFLSINKFQLNFFNTFSAGRGEKPFKGFVKYIKNIKELLRQHPNYANA